MLGLEPQPVPPHVFGIDRRRLRYGLFPNNGEGIRFGEYHSVDLRGDCFTEGPLGGSVKELALLAEAVSELTSKVSMPLQEASLVLPDDWLRITFSSADELPRKAQEREEVLRWKLKLQVPFRVEDLRLDAREVPPLAAQDEAKRVVMGFGSSQLLDQIEEAFGQAGIRLGHVSNQSLSLLTALEPAFGGLDLAAVTLVTDSAYSLLIVSRGEPVVHRFKSYRPELPAEAKRRLVLRDLRLTRTFLGEKVGDDHLRRIVLVSPSDAEELWRGWLAEVFETEPRLLAEEWPFLSATSPSVSADEVAPLLGAACTEVA